MKIHRIPKPEPLGYCHACHNRAAVELDFSSKRPVLRLCERDARHLVEKLTARLNDGNGNGAKNRPNKSLSGG
jgi:hypothetical protein